MALLGDAARSGGLTTWTPRSRNGSSAPAWADAEPLTGRARRLMIYEILVVFGVSLGANAVRAVVSLIGALTAPESLSTQHIVINASRAPGRPWLDLSFQLVAIATGVAPALLVLYLLARNGERPPSIGVDTSQPGRDLLRGAGLAAVIGGGLYLGVRPAYAVAIAAVFRGSYHLHQGIGPFLGNVVMGVIFGVLFLRWQRANPMIIAHTLINSVAFIGYTLLAPHVGWLP
jgi:hypothetical protein